MGKTQHLVLTRFNLRHAEWEHDCRGRSPYDQPVEIVRTTPLRFEEICAEFSLTECGPL